MDVINGVRSIYGIEKWLRYKNVHQLATIDFMVSMLLNCCDPISYLKLIDLTTKLTQQNFQNYF